MRSRICIERDDPRRTVSVHCLLEETFGCSHIPLCREQEIYRVTLLIDGTIQICPPALHIYICLVAAPRSANRPGVPAPPLLEFRDVPLDPAQNGRMCEFDPALAHHIHQIARTQFVTQIGCVATSRLSSAGNLKRPK